MKKDNLNYIETKYSFSDSNYQSKQEDLNFIEKCFEPYESDHLNLISLKEKLVETQADEKNRINIINSSINQLDKQINGGSTRFLFYFLVPIGIIIFIGIASNEFWLFLLISVSLGTPIGWVLTAYFDPIFVSGLDKEKKVKERELKIFLSNSLIEESKDEILETKVKVLVNHQLDNFNIWRSKNNDKYPFNLGFYHDHEFENQILIYIESIINERLAYGDIEHRYAKFAQYLTILETDKIMIEKGAKDYSLVYIKRSSNPDITPGMYIYSNKNDRLDLFHPPYLLYEFEDDTKYLIFNSNAYQKTIHESKSIKYNSIIKFELFGTELMQSTVSNTFSKTTHIEKTYSNIKQNMVQKISPPGLFGTVISQLMFGSSYTVLKGASKMMNEVTNRLDNIHNQMTGINERLEQIDNSVLKVVEAINNISIQTTHKITDTRSVQIIFEDNSDLELEGISIYYDLNRYLTSKNPSKPIESKLKDAGQKTSNLSEEEATIKIEKFKKMYDSGLIDEEEFKEMKREILRKV